MKKEDKREIIKFLIKDYSISEFENLIYQRKDWEQEFGQEIYLELISFNFKQKDAYTKLSKIILGNIISENEFKRNTLRKYFKNFGWTQDRINDFEINPKHNSKAYHYAVKILREFGGLEIELLFSHSSSHKDFISFESFPSKSSPWNSKIDPLFSIASFGHGDCFLYVNNNMDFYLWNSISDEIHYIAEGFENAIESILEHSYTVYGNRINKETKNYS